MTENHTDAIAALFTRAGEAHHIYERDVLNGAYHEDWHDWYAGFVIEHGISDLLGTPVTAKQLIAFFKQVSADHRAEQPDEHWTRYYARALVNTSL